MLRLSIILTSLCASLTLPGCGEGALDLRQIEAEIEAAHPALAHIAPEALSAKLATQTPHLILDVREIEEYAVSHLPGAVQVSPKSSAEDIARLTDALPPEAQIIVYCSVGWRSSILGSALAEAYPTHSVSNLRGGLFAWHNQGFALVNSHGKTRSIHPYDKTWGKLIKAEEALSYHPQPASDQRTLP